MGGAASFVKSSTATCIEEEANELFPAFMLRDCTVEPADTRRAKAAWVKITDDESSEFIRQRSLDHPCFPSTCLNWFYDSFYRISGERDVESRAIYGPGLKAQVKALVGMITMILNLFGGDEVNMDRVRMTLQSLARAHCIDRGVRAYQYPRVAEILLMTFAHCLGEDWDEATHTSWVKLLSVTLSVVVPAALKDESELTPEQVEAIQSRIREAEQNILAVDQAAKKKDELLERERASTVGGGSGGGAGSV